MIKEDLLNLSLFNEAEDGAFEQVTDPVNDDQSTDIKSFKRKKRGLSITSALPKDFPSREVIYNLEGDELFCGCGARLKHIDYVITKRLEIKPAEFMVIIEKKEKELALIVMELIWPKMILLPFALPKGKNILFLEE